MANNCVTNYVIRGEKEELLSLANTLNTMINHENGYGRYWIGNLLMAFGMTKEEVLNTGCCRGTFSPDLNLVATLAFPDIDEEWEFSVDDDGLLKLSTVTAWGRSDELHTIIKDKYPSLEFFFFSTDECGNFHEIHDPENLGGFSSFYFQREYESSYYTEDEYEKFLEDMRCEYPGLTVPDDREYLSSENFIDEFVKWRDEDESREETYFYVAKKI